MIIFNFVLPHLVCLYVINSCSFKVLRSYTVAAPTPLHCNVAFILATEVQINNPISYPRTRRSTGTVMFYRYYLCCLETIKSCSINVNPHHSDAAMLVVSYF